MKLLVMVVALCFTWPIAAHADDGCAGDPQCTVHTETGGFGASVEDPIPGDSSGGTPPGTGEVVPTDLVGAGLDAVCVTTAIETGRDPIAFCGLDEDGEPPELTPGMIAVAFQTVDLPASHLIIQPPNGRTLVNFETNVYTDSGPFEVTLPPLLGHEIVLRIRPATFTWRFGDGAVQATSEPGAAYPDPRITHRYLAKGQVAPSLDTTYAATYRVDGQGPWLDVAGTVTVAGGPANLEVLTATPTLVGYGG